MRHHFHRCTHLRVIELDARDLSHARKGGSQVLEELCDAKELTPCVGLVDCDVLSAAQKRDLLSARATRLREQEGATSLLADAGAGDARALDLDELRRELLEERNEIAQENRERAAQAAGALRRNPRPISPDEEHELAAAGIHVVQDDDLRGLRTARLDVLDRALDALARQRYGACARCGGEIEVARLRESPDTSVCTKCAQSALPPEPVPAPQTRRRIP
jgi:RNA polymerase-binding transcription factor DksA